jgi:protein O-mannosyl-transferase
MPVVSGRAFGLLPGVVAMAYLPALWAGFVYDDRNDVLGNPSALADTFLDRLGVTVRPLLKASYALQDALHGPNPAAYHAVNLALHLGAVKLVAILLGRALRLAGHEDNRSRLLAGLATLLWALHPALAETVAYVSGRSVGLSTVLVLTALVAATGERPRPGLAFLAAVLAPLARETALVAPLLLLAFQITVGRDQPGRLRRSLPVWAGAMMAAALLAAFPGHRDLIGFSLDQRGPLDALRANLFAIPEILRLWLAPWRISVLPAQPVVHGWTEAATLLRLIGLLVLAVGALALRRRAPAISLAVLWALVALLPTNSLIWRVDPVALRPLYLAGLGVSLGLALVLARLRFGLAAGLVLALGLGGMTFHRAGLYADEVALFADAARKAPEDARAQTMWGLVLANAGDLAAAQRALERALILDPYAQDARNALRLLTLDPPIYSPLAP